jgi:predicted TIM-barrel fold metal-dependent hydrolase
MREEANSGESGTRSAPLFDAHLHIVDPRFPLVANDGFLPEPFTVDDYRARMANLDVTGGVVVSGSFQGFDQTYLTAALRSLGPGFVGVTQLPATASDAEIMSLDAAGVRGVRFNLRRGGSEGVEHLRDLGQRVASLAGWHVELHVDARELPALEGRLAGLERLCVDHLGLSRDGLPALLALVERGARVKASGFGRVDLDVPATVQAINDVNPEALMFGSDLPGTRARRPFQETDIDVLLAVLGPERGHRALYDNAAAWYLRSPG